MIIYKGREMTVREACALMGIDCDDFMAWCSNSSMVEQLIVRESKKCLN
jgi:hypothetical protein